MAKSTLEFLEAKNYFKYFNKIIIIIRKGEDKEKLKKEKLAKFQKYIDGIFDEKNESKTTNKKNKKNKIKTVIKEENNEENDDYEEEEKYDIKVNSENDINYENMFNETKQSDLKFLDFDKFCDIPDGENPKRNKKKKKTKAKKNTDNNSIDEELCNVSYSDDEENKTKKNALESSKTIEKQLNFFSDSLCKGIVSFDMIDLIIFNGLLEFLLL